MIPDRIRILMNNEIDGVNTAAERDELQSYFRDHPESRAYLAELSDSLRLLDDLETVSPPEDLRDRIMRSVKARDRAGRRTWQEFVFGRLRMGYAFSAAVGLLAGFLLHAAIPLDTMGRDLSALDLLRGMNHSDLAEDWVPAGPVEVAVGGGTGTVRAYRQADRVLVRLLVESSEAGSVTLSFAPASEFKGLAFGDNSGFTATAAPGSLSLIGQGTCHCDFLLAGKGDPGLILSSPSTDLSEGPRPREITWP